MENFLSFTKNNGNGGIDALTFNISDKKGEHNDSFSSELNKIEKEGFSNASQFLGDVSMLKLSLSKMTEDFKEKSKRKEHYNTKNKQPLKFRIEELKTEKIELQKKERIIKDGKIPELEGKNDELENEINLIKNNQRDSKYDNILEFNKPEFLINTFVLVFLTMFLFVFYMNSFYSAFIKNIGAELQLIDNTNNIALLFNSIFDPKTFSIASENTFMFIFILLAPFTVLSFGILIHNSYKAKKYFSIFSLTLFILLYDATLAYLIVEKIYQAKYLTGLEEMPWKFTRIFSLVEFYLVLMAGFVMYIVWGLLLHDVLEKWENSKPNKYAVKERIEKLKKNNNKLEDIRTELNQLQAQLIDIEKKIKDAEYELENVIFYNFNHLKSIIYSFVKGWAKFVINYSNDTDKELAFIQSVTEDYLTNLKKGI